MYSQKEERNESYKKVIMPFLIKIKKKYLKICFMNFLKKSYEEKI